MIVQSQPLVQDTIVCPQVTAWIFVTLNCLGFVGYNTINIFSLAFEVVVSILIAILVTVGIANKNYCCYLAGFIISLIISILLSIIILLFIFLVLLAHNNYEYNDSSAQEANGVAVTVLIIILSIILVICWILSCVLICYKKRVRELCEGVQLQYLQSLPQQPLVNPPNYGNLAPYQNQDIQNQNQNYQTQENQNLNLV